MKKTCFTLILTAMFFTAANAQLSLGLKGGVNFAYIYNHGNVASFDNNPSTSLYAKFITQYNGGAFLTIPINDSRFSIQPEVLYSAQGLRLNGADAQTGEELSGVYYPNARIKLGYVNIPVMVQYRIMMQGLNVEFGPQLGILTSAKDKTNTFDVQGKETSTTTNVKSKTNSVDFSLALGISYEYSELPLGVNIRYTLGLTDVYKDEAKLASSNDKAYTNGVFQVGLFYKFAL